MKLYTFGIAKPTLLELPDSGKLVIGTETFDLSNLSRALPFKPEDVLVYVTPLPMMGENMTKVSTFEIFSQKSARKVITYGVENRIPGFGPTNGFVILTPGSFIVRTIHDIKGVEGSFRDYCVINTHGKGLLSDNYKTIVKIYNSVRTLF